MCTAELQAEWISRLPGLDRLWALTRGDPRITVAVLDGPVVERGDDAGSAPGPAAAHGALVSSLIAGSADGTVPGIAPECTVVAVPIFSDDPGGTEPTICSQETLAAAIRTALARNACVINISASQQAGPEGICTALSTALQEALARDALVVAAAGNQGCACDTIPASVAGVLAVGAHDDAGAPLGISNWGPGQRGQGLLAPGLALPGACLGGGVCRATGTSFAAAIVSGVAALLMSAEVQRGRAPSGAAVKAALLRSCQPCRPETAEVCSTSLSGRLDVGKAMEVALGSYPGEVRREGIVTSSQAVIEQALDAQEVPASGAAMPAAHVIDPSIPGRSPALREGLRPADCGCGCGGKPEGGECTCKGAPAGATAPARPQLVYAIGRLGVSFLSAARRDSIWRAIHGTPAGGQSDVPVTPEIDLKPLTNTELLDVIRREPWQAQAVIWVLSRTEVPMYAILPSGAFAAEAYGWMVNEWADPDVEFISLPGVIAGQVTLYDGMTVDAVVPDLRGMYSWGRRRYIDALTERLSGAGAADVSRQIERFLSKIQYRVRNRGLAPEERALNATATNAFNFSDVIVEAGAQGYALQNISVEKSPINRPGSEYYDVVLTFFDPADRLGKAMFSARFTVDVSDTVPVVVGAPETWYEY